MIVSNYIRPRLLCAVGALAALLLSAGCARFGARLEPPQLSVVGVEIARGDLFEQRFKARMRVQNPNDRSIAVRGVSYTLQIGGEELGRHPDASARAGAQRRVTRFFVVPSARRGETCRRVGAHHPVRRERLGTVAMTAPARRSVALRRALLVAVSVAMVVVSIAVGWIATHRGAIPAHEFRPDGASRSTP